MNIKDKLFDLTPDWLYRLWCNVMTPGAIKRRVKFFYQRHTRGFDDSETWNIDLEFYKWLNPRLKRLIEVTQGFPGNDTYPTYDSWLNELNKRSIQLDMIVNVYDYDFDNWSYIPKDELKQLSEKKLHSKTTINMYAKYYCERDFIKWFGENIDYLGW